MWGDGVHTLGLMQEVSAAGITGCIWRQTEIIDAKLVASEKDASDRSAAASCPLIIDVEALARGSASHSLICTYKTNIYYRCR